MDRKIGKILIGVSIILILTTGLILAYGEGRGFVDADNDGICDNAADCPRYGEGRGFVDADNDGICDNAADCPRYGEGNRIQNGMGRGKCYRCTVTTEE